MKTLIDDTVAFFKRDKAVGISKFRFYLLRIFYLLIVLMLGVDVWKELLTHQEVWEPLPAVAFSFWAAFSALAIIGILHPLKMVPLLLVQFSYKLVWLIIVAYPLWLDHQLIDSSAWNLTKANFIGILIDLVVIPWFYVVKNYLSFHSTKFHSMKI